jgi:hypothetical protein
MRILSFIVIVALVCTSLTGWGQNMSPSAPVMQFDTNGHDFGNIPEGPLGSWDCWFTNTGQEPLIIRDAVGSCACTKADWLREPIAPGQRGKLTITYKTEGYPGSFKKTVYIASNAKSESKRIEVYIKGNVEPKAGNPEVKTESDKPSVPPSIKPSDINNQPESTKK